MNVFTPVFFLITGLAAALYYLAPAPRRWLVLLAADLFFCLYWLRDPSAGAPLHGFVPVILLFVCAAVSWTGGLLLDAMADGGSGEGPRSIALFLFSVLCAAPVLADRLGGLVYTSLLQRGPLGIIQAAGSMYFTLRMISYMADVRGEMIRAQRDPLKYLAYALFFPVFLQGPLLRYWELAGGLYEGNAFDRRKITAGLQLILWGLFLKLVISDRAGIVVDTVYGHTESFMGVYFLIAGVLFSLQIYTGLLGTACMAAGTAELFGFRFRTGFRQPLRAVSVTDYWERFNGTVTAWIEDYILRPLERRGNRRGRGDALPVWFLRVLAATLFGSFWYAEGLKAVFLGLLFAAYLLMGELTSDARAAAADAIRLPAGSFAAKVLGRINTFLWVTIGWILFRAPSLRTGLQMLLSILRDRNPWILFGDELLQMGIGWKDWNILLASTALLLVVESEQPRHCIRDRILAQHAVVRWGLYAAGLLAVFLFGVYGGAI